MPKVFSIISMQGGIGKSFVTALLADFLSGATNKRVLVIDIGSGGSASAMLIGWDRQDEIDEGNTVIRQIGDRLELEATRFDFDAMVQRGVSNVRQASTIDLLPLGAWAPYSFHDLPDLVNSTDLLRRAVESHLDDYEVVLVDCCGGLGTLTRNALRISDGYIIPGDSRFNLLTGTTSILDAGNILGKVNKFADEIGKDIRLHGIVVNRYRRRRRHHVAEQLWAAGCGPVYWTPIAFVPERVLLPFPWRAESKPREYKTLRQKWGRRLVKTFTKFADDILRFEGVAFE